MPEQELNPAATKFISSLVRSLQILCNGQVEFNESIELVGHINVKIDHIYKFDYIVDEQVSKEGEDSSTTFLSNSYHSCRPSKQTHKKANPAELEQDVIFSEIPTDSQRRLKQMKNMHELEKQPESTALQRENSHQNYSVSVDKHCNEPNQMVVKLEGGEDSNDCMVLPASPVDYEGEGNRTESYSVPGPSSSFDESNGNQAILTRKRRKAGNQRTEETERQVTRKTAGGATRTQTVYQCRRCYQSFTSYRSHLLECPCTSLPNSFPNLETSVPSSPYSKFLKTCTTCGEVFHTSSDWLFHMNFKHGVNIYSCNTCNEPFGSSRLLVQHKKSVHGDHIGQRTCPLCGKTFTTTLNLRGHMNMHKGSRPYKCQKCGEAFAYSQSKHRHQKLCSK